MEQSICGLSHIFFLYRNKSYLDNQIGVCKYSKKKKILLHMLSGHSKVYTFNYNTKPIFR